MKQKAVLFVDDDPRLLASLKRGLLDEPYEVLLASSGHEALDILGSCDVDVLVTDVCMPEMSGLELVEIVRRQYPKARRVLLSGQLHFASPNASFVVRRVLSGDIFAFVPKPWDIERRLKKVVREALVAEESFALMGSPDTSIDNAGPSCDEPAQPSDAASASRPTQAGSTSIPSDQTTDPAMDGREQTGESDR